MLTLFLLAILLSASIGSFAALGVEDAKHHAAYVPVRYQTMSPMVSRWEDSLPGRVKLPWVETNGEWVAETKGK